LLCNPLLNCAGRRTAQGVSAEEQSGPAFYWKVACSERGDNATLLSLHPSLPQAGVVPAFVILKINNKNNKRRVPLRTRDGNLAFCYSYYFKKKEPLPPPLGVALPLGGSKRYRLRRNGTKEKMTAFFGGVVFIP
jgi:hypothetical protein